MRGEGVIAPDASAPQVELLEDAPTDEEKKFEDNKPVGSSPERPVEPSKAELDRSDRRWSRTSSKWSKMYET